MFNDADIHINILLITGYIFKYLRLSDKKNTQDILYALIPIECLMISDNNSVQNYKLMTTLEEKDLSVHDMDIETVICNKENDQPNLMKTKEIMLNNTEKFKLHRQNTRPIYNDSVERLEELSFVNIFPFGKNGYKEPRDLKFAIGMSYYVKCRLMSKDSRFQNIQYLFYLLSLCEDEKI